MKTSNFKAAVLALGATKIERGASMVEYTVAVGILLGVFVAAVAFLQPRTQERTDETVNVMEGSNPCSGSSSRLSAYPCF